MVLATTVRTPSSRVELPLLTLQILTQLMYDRDALKQHYESCKNELDLHKQNKVEEADRWQQRADELQAEITTCRSTADDCLSQLKTQTTLEKEIMHNNSKLFEAKDAAQKRVQELLDIVKSLEDDVESRSRLMKGFQQYLRNLILIHDDLLKQHSKITTITKHHKSEILRIDIRLSDIFQNFIRSFQNYQKEEMVLATGVTTVRTPSSRVELPLLTLQILTQLMYDRDALKQHYESCKQRLSQLETQTTHNNSKLFEAKVAAEQRVQELLGRVKSLEDEVENRSRLVKSFQQYLRNLTLMHDELRKKHSKITGIAKHQKSEILRIDTSLLDSFQNTIRSYQKYQKELKDELLKKLLNGKSKEERLLEAAMKKNVDDISLLLYFGADIETTDRFGRTALFFAVESGNLRSCEVLLDGGANIEAIPTSHFDGTPIYLAVATGNMAIVRLFVERGANLSIKAMGGYTPLKAARFFESYNVVRYLEELGAPE